MSIEPSLTRTMPVASGATQAAAASADAAPASRFKINRLHHHAYYCRNSEETRHFYEDILQLPLTMTVVLPDDILYNKGDYCHTFFELGDGSSIAFFEYPALWAEGNHRDPDEFEHHLAFKVDSEEVLEYYRDRLLDAGVKARLIDHQVYKSLYFNDPNGLNLELLADTPITAAVEAQSRSTAHADLDRWMIVRAASGVRD